VHSILGPKAPVRSRDEADFTEQFAQDHARLERLAGIPVEPFGYLSAVERRRLRQHGKNLGRLFGRRLRVEQFTPFLFYTLQSERMV
jgi:hypothetical protein